MAPRRNPTTKFVGTTEECFKHLFQDRTRHERYALHKLLSDFCGVRGEAVSRWERGRQQVRGTSLVRLRCFLHLAGYEVKEVDGFQEPVRSLLLIVGLGIAPDGEKFDAHALEKSLGYDEDSNLKSLYRIILRNEGYSDETAKSIREICDSLRDKLDESMREMRSEIKRVLAGLTVEEPRLVARSASPAPSEPVDPLAVTSFARSVALTLSLGKAIAGNPAAAVAVRRATRGGMDLEELADMLGELLR